MVSYKYSFTGKTAANYCVLCTYTNSYNLSHMWKTMKTNACLHTTETTFLPASHESCLATKVCHGKITGKAKTF